MTSNIKQLDTLDKFFVGIILIIFAGIVIHAPIIASIGNLFPAMDNFIKSWKEILMIAASGLGVLILMRKKQLAILKQPVLLMIAAYSLLHVLLVPLFWQGSEPTLSGMLIDLRYLLFFTLVYICVVLYPSIRKKLLIVFFAGALLVCIFAVLQVFILPRDVLSYIGYNKNTIIPYLFVDENEQFVRINSTLRGPNPLGAYAGIVLAVMGALWIRTKKIKGKKATTLASVVVFGAVVALWASYSRSALIAAFVAICVVVVVHLTPKVPRWFWAIPSIIIVFAVIGVLSARESHFVSNIFFHDNPTTGAVSNSNDGHISSLEEGTDRMVRQPFGAGIGSTGSASMYGNEPIIIENQYLFIAHEVGWIGLVLFLIIFVKILQQLWRRRADWLALGVFASGIGMALIGLLLPVWVDDTVAIIWWGLAAIAVAQSLITTKGAHVRTLHKTSKRTA